MADPSPKPAFEGFTLETAISVTKSILLSIGIISTLMLLKAAIIPKLVSLVITTLHFRLCLSPPYVFIVFNFIIFAVAASSTFRRHKDASETNNYTPISHENTHVAAAAASTHYKSTHEDQNFSITGEIWNRVSNEDEQGKEEAERKPVKWENSSIPTPFSEKLSDPSSEKFCAYSGEKVEEEEVGEDSMDATWKAIMERQGKQTPPQLKKSQTWDSPPSPLTRAVVNGDEEPMKKSEMFRQTMSFRRRISMSSEELRNRAEAFIEMVNRNIRLQRQESEQRFVQAMKRSV